METMFIIKTDGLGSWIICTADGDEIMRAEGSANRFETIESLEFLVAAGVDYLENN